MTCSTDQSGLIRLNQPAYVLRTSDKDGRSFYKSSFQWPESGHVAAPDWRPDPHCGHGLHGLLWGEGNASYLTDRPDSRWQIVKIDRYVTVEGAGKVKFPEGEVVFNGTKEEAVAEIIRLGAAGKAVVYATVTAGARGTATAGYAGTATAGYYGTATAGYAGTATAGYYGTATAGDYGTATAGYAGTATAGARGTATAGYAGTATAGDYGTATAGDYGTAAAGDYGTATAGARGTATAGYAGTATAGSGGIIQVKRYDPNAGRYRLVTGYIGENGLQPDVAYRLNDKGIFVPAR